MTEKDTAEDQDETEAGPVAGTPHVHGTVLRPAAGDRIPFNDDAAIAAVARRIAESLQVTSQDRLAEGPLTDLAEATAPPALDLESIEPTPVSDGFDFDPPTDNRVAVPAHYQSVALLIEPIVEHPQTTEAAPSATIAVEAESAPLSSDSEIVQPSTARSQEPPSRSGHPGFGVPPLPPHDEIEARPRPKPITPLRQYAGKAIRIAGYVLGGYLAAVLVLIALYRFVNPPASTLIAYHWLTGGEVSQTWVPITQISPQLIRAVVVSEDWRFCEHNGIDLDAIEEALEKAGEGIPRGASTISMQVTKNLFLSQSKSYVRKAIEIPLTLVAELVWPKSRMLEIYLNIAEWGPGIFGAEAAAQFHFNKSARGLSEREAAQLAASLPNPMIRDAGDPGPRTARKASIIQSRMRNAGGAAGCALLSNHEPKSAKEAEPETKKRTGAALGL